MQGLTFVESTGHFIAIEEVKDHEQHGLHPYTHELKVNEDSTDYSTVQVMCQGVPVVYAKHR